MIRPVHGGNLAWAAELAGCSPAEILDFSASISPLGPPASAIAAIQSQFGLLRHYPDPDYFELRSILSQVHQLPVEWFLPGNGSAELLTLAGQDLAKLEATYLVTPAFGDYQRALQACQARVLTCPLNLAFPTPSQEIEVNVALASLSRLKNLESGIQSTNCGLLLNNPHNPTGQLFLKEALFPYLDQFALVVIDEAFMDFLPPAQQQSLIAVVQEHPNLVILRSLTKFYSLPGLRLGYAIAHPDRLKDWQQRRDPWPVNVLAAAAATAVLQDIPFQQQTWSWLAAARLHLFEELTKLPGLHPYWSAANFLLVRSHQPGSQIQHQLLQQHQILIRDCLSFPELGDHYFRVAVRSEAENQRLVSALAEVL